MIKHLLRTTFLVLLSSKIHGLSFGIYAGYMFNFPIDNVATYDAVPLNFSIKHEKFILMSGVLLSRSVPETAFEPELGYDIRMQYKLLQYKKINIYGNYSFLKFKQQTPIDVYGIQTGVHIIHHLIGIGINLPLISNWLWVITNIEYGFVKYHFDEPWPGKGKYYTLMSDFGLKYEF